MIFAKLMMSKCLHYPSLEIDLIYCHCMKLSLLNLCLESRERERLGNK